MSMGTVYLLMVGGSTLLLVIMLLTGLGHHDVTGAGHDVGHDLHFGHGHDADFHGAELHGGDISADGPGILGIRLILAFVIGFGVAGYIGWVYQWSFPPHWLVGIAGGLVAYIAIYQLLKVFYRMQANTLVSASRLVGVQGVVTSEILVGSVGEVKTTDPKTGQTHYLRAMFTDPEKAVKKGTRVTVLSVAGGLAKVE